MGHLIDEDELACPEPEPIAYLTWHQGMVAVDDYVEYLELSESSELSCDGTPAFPVYTHPARADVPDLFWNCGDIDSGDRGIDHVVSVIADGMDLSSTDTFPIMRAKRLSDRDVCITVDSEGDVQWKWVDAKPEPESLESIAYVTGWNDCRQKVLECTPTGIKCSERLPSDGQMLWTHDALVRLAGDIWAKHYKATSPNFKILEGTVEVVGQIENMVAGMSVPNEFLEEENAQLKAEVFELTKKNINEKEFQRLNTHIQLLNANVEYWRDKFKRSRVWR